MRRAWKALGLALAAVVGLCAALVIAIAIAPHPAIEARPGPAVPGLFHVHAEASHDGFGTLDEATRAAAEAGARFLFLTEHNVVRPDAPVVRDGVLVVPGVEISAQAGHVIALGLSEAPPQPERGEAVLEAIARRGGLAVLAHPVNLRRPWSDPSTDGFAGFEALSLDSWFREAKALAPWRLALALAAIGDLPKGAALLATRPDGALARYDEIAARRDVTLLCGVDAHGLPPYAASFGALRLFVPVALSGEPQADAAALIEAIRAGRTFCSVPALGDASSFSFAREADTLVARVDAPGVTLALLRDGERVAQGPGPELRLPAAPGVWRAEVTVDEPGFPFAGGAFWIASSALRVHER